MARRGDARPAGRRRVAITGTRRRLVLRHGQGRLLGRRLNGPAPEGEHRVVGLRPHRLVRRQRGSPDVDRFAQFSVAAAEMALEDAGELDVDPARAGVISRTGVGGLETLQEQIGVLYREGSAPGLAVPRADDDGKRRRRADLDAARVARSRARRS